MSQMPKWLEHPFFTGFSDQHLRALSDLAQPVEFLAGEVVLREGEPADRFYLIQSGLLQLESTRTDGRRFVVALLQQGDVLGWSWFFPPYQWHFDARAVEPTCAALFRGHSVRQCCEADPDLGYAVVKRVDQVLIQCLHATRRQLAAEPGEATPVLAELAPLLGFRAAYC